MSKIIDKKVLNDFRRVHADSVGNLYEYEGKIIRIINKSAVRSVEKLLQSGLIEELVKEHLLVETWKSDYITEDDSIVLEHKKINVMQHRSQWSFEMMKTAALCVLRINQICNKFGYELKDSHQENIMFEGTDPLWVDFGSIVKRRDNQEWCAIQEFMKCYYYPLVLQSRGYVGIIQALYKSSLCELEELQSIFYGLPPRLIKNMKPVFGQVSDIQRLCDKISKLRLNQKTDWGDYQDKYWDRSNERFEYEIDWIKNTEDISTMVEIGANQGAFSYQCSKEVNFTNIIATDYDYVAVDKMFLNLKKHNAKNVTPLILDFVGASDDDLRNKCSDLLVANALTHHLLLTQCMTAESMMKRFGLLTNKYLIVEFMPWGVNKHKTPSWYTIDWFLSVLQEGGFKVLHIKDFKRRIVIIAKKRVLESE